MWKLLLLLALLPTVLAVLARKWLCDRVVDPWVGKMTKCAGRELAQRILAVSGQGDSVVIEEKRRVGVEIEPPSLALTPELAEARDVVSLGQVAALTGQVLVAREQPGLLKWRQWVVRFSWAFPIFTFVVVLFAVVVAKLAIAWGIVSVLGALGVASALSLASVMIELEGAKLAADLVERSRVLPRRDDEEAVQRCCRAFAFRRVVPGAVEWMMGEPRKADEEGR